MNKHPRHARTLRLRRETIVDLSQAEIGQAAGGSYTCLASCYYQCQTVELSMCGPVLCEPN
jgi:hypothetical protein